MDHIKNIVHQIIKSSSSEQSWKSSIIENWSEIIGSLASKVFVEKIYQDTIILAVIDSCWMQELHLLSELLKKKINDTLSQPRIKTIRFKYSTQKPPYQAKKTDLLSVAIQEKTLSAAEQEALARIQDQELSQALTRFLQKCHHFS